MALFPILLCGGSGTRLWPFSRRETPKQFVVSTNGKPLFQWTYERAASLPDAVEIVCVGNNDHRFLIESLCGTGSPRPKLVLEPAPRNTAASIASAALFVAETDPRGLLTCMPADHHIENTGAFQAAVRRSIDVARQGWIVTMGVVPREASQFYGYVLPGDAIASEARRVQGFVEKPNAEDARAYLEKGYLWNSGIVVARADILIDALQRHVPHLLSACRSALQRARRDGRCITLEAESFLACEAISFDFAVLEKEKKLAVVDFNGDWSDVGNWPEFAKFCPATDEENRLTGQVAAKSCKNTVIFSPERLTVALGLRDCVVVDTPDALLVAERSALGELRNAVAELELAGREEVIRHRRVVRPWGYFEKTASGSGYQVKRITVLPAAALSLQYHNHRSEHWIVVRGMARVTCDAQTFDLKANEGTYISRKSVHRVENLGAEVLEIIEVQIGNYLGEDDIVRLEDRYGRI